MPMQLQLENFETGRSAVTHRAADLPGYDAGFADGERAALAEQKRIDAALVQSLSDLAFGFEEARQQVLTGIAPLFRTLVDQLLPRIVDESFHARLVETLMDLATERSRAPVRLIVHPDQVAAVSALLPSVTGLDIDLHQDPEVGAHGALISQGPSEALLDLDDLISDIRRTLSALFDQSDPSQELSNHG